jgi:O-antigen/teichoic acid export membrane protein
MINDFVELWVGDEYCLPCYNIVLFAVIMYCNILFPALLVARNAKGLYKESKNFTIWQTVLNLGLTVLLVPKFGIFGALIGTVLARVCITIPFNYRMVEKKVFTNQKTKWYELLFGFFIAVIAATVGLMIKQLIESSMLFGTNIYLSFVLAAILVSLIVGLVTVVLFYFMFPDYRRLLMRVIMIIKRIFGKKKRANI